MFDEWQKTANTAPESLPSQKIPKRKGLVFQASISRYYVKLRGCNVSILKVRIDIDLDQGTCCQTPQNTQILPVFWIRRGIDTLMIAAMQLVDCFFSNLHFGKCYFYIHYSNVIYSTCLFPFVSIVFPFKSSTTMLFFAKPFGDVFSHRFS